MSYGKTTEKVISYRIEGWGQTMSVDEIQPTAYLVTEVLLEHSHARSFTVCL